MKTPVKILVVDDEAGIREMLSYELLFREYKVTTAANGEEALEKIKKEKFQLIISDIKMPKLGGMELLEAVKKTDPDIEVIMSTGYGTIETAVSAMKMGAYDFVQKPFNLDEILALIDKALEKSELKTLLGVYEASKAIFSSIKLHELLPIMADLSTQILKADDASIMLMSGGGHLEVAATSGLNKEMMNSRLALGERVAGKVAQDEGPVIIDGPLDKDPRFSDVPSLRDIRSSIVFPLLMENRLLGVLNANRTLEQKGFTGTDLRYATIFCAQISQAIHNATLYNELDKKMAEIQQMQSQLIESEKLAAIGKLAAGVAHEINNPLTGIMGFSELMLQSKDLKPEQREDVENILQQSQRCRRIVQNLLQFSRRRKTENASVDLKATVEAALQLMKYDLTKSNVDTFVNFPADIPRIMGDSYQLEQVFLNLIANARQAMEGVSGAKLTVIAARQGETVVLRFEDNGCGIPKDNLSKLFDPFFTTKPVGQGTGLGLSISYGIIQQHNGKISAENLADGGAAFTLVLPVGETGNDS